MPVDRVHGLWTARGWPVHGSIVDHTMAGGRRAHRSSRSGPLRAWRLAAEAREARGRRGEPHRLHGRAAAGRRWADDGEERTAAAALGGGALRCGGGGGRGGEGCGIAVGWRWPFIGSGGVWRGGGYRQEMLAVNGGNDARV